MASSGLRKILSLVISNTLCVWGLVCPTTLMDTVVNGSHIAMPVVIAIVLLAGVMP